MLINLAYLNILKFTEEEAGQKVCVEAHLFMFIVGVCTVVCFLNHSNIYRGCYKVA